MFASLGVSSWFKSQFGAKQSLPDEGQAEGLHDGPAKSEKCCGGTEDNTAFVASQELDEKGTPRRCLRSMRDYEDPVRGRNEHLVFLVSEYWTAEDHSALKGDNHRIHAIFSSVKEANCYAEKFVHDILEPYVKSDAWHADDREQDISVDNVKASKTSFMDGTTRWTLDWGHCTEIEVEEFPMYSSLQDWERKLWMKDPLSWCRGT